MRISYVTRKQYKDTVKEDRKMSDDGPKILGSDGHPISTMPPIVVVKSRHPLPPNLIQNIGMTMRASVIVLPLEIDIMTGKLAIEEIEAIHGAIHNILEIKEEQ